MVVLWALAGLLVAGYYHVPAVFAVLEPLDRLQRENGWIAAFLNRFLFSGLLPGVFILSVRALRPRRPLAVIFVQTMLSGVCGIVSGWMFEWHAAWFGTGTEMGTLLVKTVMYQFVWVVLFFMPLGAVVYFWIGRDFSFRRVRDEWPERFLGEMLLPNLIANWAVWIPLSLLIHLFPTALQIQVTGLANAFLSLVFLTIGRRGAASRSAR